MNMSTPIEWVVNTKKEKVYSVSHTQAVIRGNHTLEEDLAKIENTVHSEDGSVVISNQETDNAVATCKYGTSVFKGADGNNLKVVVAIHVDETTEDTSTDNTEDTEETPVTLSYDVSTYYKDGLVETQTVTSASELVDSQYIIWDKNSELTEEEVALKGGVDGVGSASITVNSANTTTDTLNEDGGFVLATRTVEKTKTDSETGETVKYCERLQLIGKPDGTLTWCGAPIVTTRGVANGNNTEDDSSDSENEDLGSGMPFVTVKGTAQEIEPEHKFKSGMYINGYRITIG